MILPRRRHEEWAARTGREPSLESLARHTGALVGSALFLGLLLTAILFFRAATCAEEEALTGLEWTLIILVCLVASGRLSWIVAEGFPRLYELTFWTFIYVFLVLAPIVQFASGRYPSTTPTLTREFNTPALGIVAVGSVATLLGVLSSRVQRKDAIDVGLQEHRVWMLMHSGLAASGYYISKVGPNTLLKSRASLSHAVNTAWPNPSTAALVSGAATMPLLVAFGALLRLRDQRQKSDRPGPSISLAVTGSVLLFTVNPISSPRYYSGTVLLSMAAMLGAYATPKRVRCSAIAFLMALIFIFPSADLFRHNTTPSIEPSGPVASLTSGDFDAIDQINNTFNYVDDMGSSHGRQALGPILFWVPRSLWESKPEDTGVLVARHRGYRFQNLSAPLFAELFINGGWGLLAFGMFLIGRQMARGDMALSLTWTRGAGGILGLILPFYLVILLRGSLLQATALLAVLFSCATWVSRRRRSGVLPEIDVKMVGKCDEKVLG